MSLKIKCEHCDAIELLGPIQYKEFARTQVELGRVRCAHCEYSQPLNPAQLEELRQHGIEPNDCGPYRVTQTVTGQDDGILPTALEIFGVLIFTLGLVLGFAGLWNQSWAGPLTMLSAASTLMIFLFMGAVVRSIRRIERMTRAQTEILVKGNAADE